MWCATTPTVHFSDAVVFFQSASLRRSSTPVASCAFASNCFASASVFAAMGPPHGGDGSPTGVVITHDTAGLKACCPVARHAGTFLTAVGSSTIFLSYAGLRVRSDAVAAPRGAVVLPG